MHQSSLGAITMLRSSWIGNGTIYLIDSALHDGTAEGWVGLTAENFLIA